MSKICSVCDKSQMTGNKVSHSNRKSKRTWKVNVQKVKIIKDGTVSSEYVCTRCLRSNKVTRAI